jgi:hypothetical protein
MLQSVYRSDGVIAWGNVHGDAAGPCKPISERMWKTGMYVEQEPIRKAASRQLRMGNRYGAPCVASP